MILEELEHLGLGDLGLTLKEYKYVNLGGKVVYVEGQTGIQTLTKEEIEIKLHKKVCHIKGVDLYVKYYDASTVVVCGNIISVVVL